MLKICIQNMHQALGFGLFGWFGVFFCVYGATSQTLVLRFHTAGSSVC